MTYKDDYLFIDAVQKVFAHEGGYVNDSVDPGGETKYGISKRSYPAYNIKSLTIEQAMQIYYMDYWAKNNYNQIEFAPLAAKVLDIGVNIGACRVNKFLQELLTLTEDGVIGPKTIHAINSTEGQSLLNDLLSRARKYYEDIIAIHPNLAKFKKGWLNRLRS